MNTGRHGDEILPQSGERQPGIKLPESRESGLAMSMGKLEGKVALIVGGESGIGRAVAVAFACEGADVAIAYLNECSDVEMTATQVREQGRRCFLVHGDIGSEHGCREIIDHVLFESGRLDILVNNVAERRISTDGMGHGEATTTRIFRTNIYAHCFLCKAALPYLKEGSVIINTSCVAAYAKDPDLVDYTTANISLFSFTHSLALSLASRGIRANAVAVSWSWMPPVAATLPKQGEDAVNYDTSLEHAGQADEVAPCYVFLASDDSAFMSGQVLNPHTGTHCEWIVLHR